MLSSYNMYHKTKDATQNVHLNGKTIELGKSPEKSNQ